MIIQILALLITAALSAEANPNQCGTELLKDCYCGKTFVGTDSLFTVNCTNTGFTTTTMLENLPEEVEMLIFRGNHIQVLDTNVLGELSELDDLKIIDMSNNGITEIKGKAFHHVPNVRRLILNHNNISISKQADVNYHHARVFSNFYNLEELHLTNAFADNTDATLANDLHDIFVNSNLTKLYKLHLEQNEIKNFKDESVFCDLQNLHDLYMADNNIPSLNFDVLCLKKLRYLDLQHNNISKFNQRDLDNLDKLAEPSHVEKLTLEIEGNPFRCDIAIKNLYNWLYKTLVIVKNKERLECHQAKYGKKYIMNLKNLAEAKHARISQALSVLLVVLSLIILTLLGAFLYLRRDKTKAKLSPLFHTLTKKVYYTTIESQDV